MKRLAILLLFFMAQPACGAEIAIGLTDDIVEVNANFTGAKLVLFGALSGESADNIEASKRFDIVAVVRGPASTFEVRPIVRQGMIWTAGSPIYMRDAPGAFLVHSTRPLDEFAPPALRASFGLEARALDLAPNVAPSNGTAAAMMNARGRDAIAEAFLTAAKKAGLYAQETGAVAFKKGSLFSIDIELPPKTPVGDYDVNVYLIGDGKVLSSDSVRLAVNKVGLERQIYDLAHTRPIAYGFVCVFLAVAAGWLAAEALRKRA